jgi:hypothetical protein
MSRSVFERDDEEEAGLANQGIQPAINYALVHNRSWCAIHDHQPD